MRYVGWDANSGFVEVDARNEEIAEMMITGNQPAVFLGPREEIVENMEAFIKTAKQSTDDVFKDDLDEWIENIILDHDEKGTRVTDDEILEKMRKTVENGLYSSNGLAHIDGGFAIVNSLGAVEYKDKYIIIAHVEHGVKDDESTNIVYGWDTIEMSKDLQGVLSWDAR